MRSPGLTILMSVALTLAGCGCAIKGSVSAKGEVGPLTSNILHVSGRFGVGSACPVGPRVALTAAHVVDIAPLDPRIPLYPVVWEQGNLGGVATPRGAYKQRDLAIVDLDADVEFYPIAKEPPPVGSKVWISGFDWRSRERAFHDRVWESKVTHVGVGLVVFEPPIDQGASGSCVLDDQGRIVAIVHWRWPVQKLGEAVGVGVLVAGESF